MSAFKIPKMLFVLAKKIFKWCLVAEDTIGLAQKIIHISGCRKYVCGKGALGGEDLPPPEANDIWKYQIKWNHLHHMGPEFFFSLFLRPYYFFSTPLVPFYFFLAYQEPK